MSGQNDRSLSHRLRCKPRIGKLVALFVSILLMCLTSIINTPVYAAPTTTNAQPTYVDKKLGFSLQLPIGWIATPHTSMHDTQYADVVFTNSKLPGTHLEVNVMRRSTAAIAFAQQGKATLHIGSYPAFQQDTPGSIQMPTPCLGRTMLANNDIITASWCATDAATHKQAFENILATYRNHSTTSIQASSLVQSQTPVNPVQTCQQVFSGGSNNPPSVYPNDEWGTESVNPTDSTWTNSFGEGVAVCDDYYSHGGYEWENGYLFQCVELANRFINEEWNLPGFNGDAFAYFDNYQNGTYYNGLARGSAYNATLTPDASQGSNSALPVPGDLIIFQDVGDGVNWTSGELSGDAGHVVVVTSVTSSQVNVVQQNWHGGETHSFSWSLGNNGYHIQDNSGVYHRITRGWIHFAANTNSGSSTFAGSDGQGGSKIQTGYLPGSLHQLDIFALGNDGNVYEDYKTGDANSTWSGWGINGGHTSLSPLTTITVGTLTDGRPYLFGTDANGYVWSTYKQTTDPSSAWSNWGSQGSQPTPFSGQIQIGTLPGGQMDLFAIGTNGTIYQNYKTGDVNSSWSGWVSVGNPGDGAQLQYLSAGSLSDGRLQLFVTDGNGNVFSTYMQNTAPTSWLSWGSAGSQPTPFSGQVQTAMLPGEHTDLFVIGADGNIYQNYKTGDANSTWSGWISVGNPNSGAQPQYLTVGTFADGRLNLFTNDTNGNASSSYMQNTSATSWLSWGSAGSQPTPFSGQLQVGTLLDGRLYLFIMGTQSNLYGDYKTGDSNSPWSGWGSNGQVPGGV